VTARIVPRYSFTLIRCPVCKQMVAPQGEHQDAVDCEDEDGRTVFYHAACWAEALTDEDGDVLG
jgi:hypothetical protein